MREIIENYYGLPCPEGSFTWAVAKMMQGKKVKRKHWKRYFIKLNYNNRFVGMDNKVFDIKSSSVLATDWEIYEENIFGDFEVTEGGDIFCYDRVIFKKDFKDLEKAIKCAKELKNENNK